MLKKLLHGFVPCTRCSDSQSLGSRDQFLWSTETRTSCTQEHSHVCRDSPPTQKLQGNFDVRIRIIVSMAWSAGHASFLLSYFFSTLPRKSIEDYLFAGFSPKIILEDGKSTAAAFRRCARPLRCDTGVAPLARLVLRDVVVEVQSYFPWGCSDFRNDFVDSNSTASSTSVFIPWLTLVI